MLPFLIPLLAIGACVFAARRHRETSSTVVSGDAGAVPSPIAVLCGFLRAGQHPPPPVILCALAEAEATHQPEIADSIVRAFVLPVVMADRAHTIASAKNANVVGAAPRHHVPLYSKEQILERETHKAQAPAPPDGGAGAGQAGQAQPVKPGESEADAIARALAEAQKQTRGMSETRAAHVAHTSHVSRGEYEIIGFAPEWDTFADRLAREAPTYLSKRHVGRWRTRRERLIELGIDPVALVGDERAQREALAAEMRDAFAHAQNGGLVDHVGTIISIDGVDHAITLSGVLGVIQVAGLEGACAWLESPADRRRFKNTTAAFTRTNGVF